MKHCYARKLNFIIGTGLCARPLFTVMRHGEAPNQEINGMNASWHSPGMNTSWHSPKSTPMRFWHLAGMNAFWRMRVVECECAKSTV